MSEQENKPQSAPIGEIEHGPSAFEKFLDKNQKTLVIIGLLLVIGVSAYVILDGIAKGKREEAAKALSSANDLDAITQVTKDFAGTPAAGMALIKLANQYWNAGRQDDAINSLRQFLSDHPTHPAYGNGQFNLGSRLLEQGKTEEAKPLFQAVIDNDNSQHLAQFALVRLGDIAAKTGDQEAAKKLYEQARDQYPVNHPNSKTEATNRLELLGVASPSLVKKETLPPAPSVQATPTTPSETPTPPEPEVTPEVLPTPPNE